MHCVSPNGQQPASYHPMRGSSTALKASRLPRGAVFRRKPGAVVLQLWRDMLEIRFSQQRARVVVKERQEGISLALGNWPGLVQQRAGEYHGSSGRRTVRLRPEFGKRE